MSPMRNHSCPNVSKILRPLRTMPRLERLLPGEGYTVETEGLILRTFHKAVENSLPRRFRQGGFAVYIHRRFGQGHPMSRLIIPWVTFSDSKRYFGKARTVKENMYISVVITSQISAIVLGKFILNAYPFIRHCLSPHFEYSFCAVNPYRRLSLST